MKKLNTRLSEFIKDVIKLIRKPVMSILPGQLSFFLLLSIIPIALIIGIITSYVSVSTNDLIDVVSNGLPAQTSSLIIPLISGRGVDYNIILLIVSALLLVSKGTKSIMRVANIIYNTHDSKSFKSIIKSFLLAIVLILLFAFLIIVPVLGSRILKFLHNFSIASNLTEPIINSYDMLKWPISILIIFINIKIIYIYAPNRKIPSKSVNKGAIFTTLMWVILTTVYSYYINHLSSYNIFYGGASNIIVLMLWIYFISYIFVLGMSINASYLKNTN